MVQLEHVAEPRVSGWRVLVESDRPAAEQMAIDARLAAQAMPAVRVFTWNQPAVSLGYKQQRPEWLVEASQELACVERPTGGGIAFHGSDVSIAVVVPQELRLPLALLMRVAGRSALRLCQSYGAPAVFSDGGARLAVTYCLAQQSPYAVSVGGRKIAGFALRRYAQSWLIQGSLLVGPVPEPIGRRLPRPVREAMAGRAASLSACVGREVNERNTARRWADHWTAWWEEDVIQALACA